MEQKVPAAEMSWYHRIIPRVMCAGDQGIGAAAAHGGQDAVCSPRKGCMLFECVCYLSKHRPDICFNRHKYNVLHTKIALCVFVYTHTNK